MARSPCFFGTTKTLRRPVARAASLGFLRLAVPSSAFAYFAPRGVSNAPPRGLDLLRFGQPVPMIRLDGDDRNSQVPGEPQMRLRHAQATPVGSCASDRYDAATQAPATGRTRAPALGLSRFSHMALPLAVYASPRRLPARTQDSLPAAGQALPDGLPTRRVPMSGFVSVSLHLSPPLPSFAWRNPAFLSPGSREHYGV